MSIVTSSTGIFSINMDEPQLLYARPGAVNHPWIEIFDGKPKDSQGRVPYIFAYPLNPNDCLQFAESMASGILGYNEEACIFKERHSNRKFGYTDKINIEIAKNSANVLNENANPAVGEAYAIVRKRVIKGKAPYHIGYVLFRDDDTNITLEADAGNLDLHHPVFDMYSTTDPARSWHTRYFEDYKPASTIVILRN
jgi:hypothetical protein